MQPLILSRGFINNKVLHDVVDILNGRSNLVLSSWADEQEYPKDSAFSFLAIVSIRFFARRNLLILVYL